MREFLAGSAYFGILLSLAAYYIGVRLQKRFRLAIFNPMLVAIVLTISALLLLGIDYESYNLSGRYLSYLLTPTTVCLAIPLYRQLQLLRQNLKAIVLGILSGVLTSLCCVLLLSMLFGLSHAEYVTLLPKSITSAIGMGVVEELGGYPAITVPVIVVTGILGNMFGPGFLKLLRISDPVAKGIAFGTSAHAFGTSRAIQMGETEGAMSSLSIVVAGIITVVLASVFAQIY